MTDLARVRIALTGWSGAPGVITEHYSQGSAGSWNETVIQDLVDEVYDRYAGNSATFITDMSLTVEPSVGIFDAASGELVDYITAPTAPAVIDATGAGQSLSRATMLGIQLRTADFRNGRRVQGRLFWGPIQSGMFGGDGLIQAGIATDVAGTFEASISGLGPRLCVYSRPRAVGDIPGNWADVTNVTVSRTPFVLRSRRD